MTCRQSHGKGTSCVVAGSREQGQSPWVWMCGDLEDSQEADGARPRAGERSGLWPGCSGPFYLLRLLLCSPDLGYRSTGPFFPILQGAKLWVSQVTGHRKSVSFSKAMFPSSALLWLALIHSSVT